MRYIVPSVLLIVALIHALPVSGVLGAGKLAALYGFAVEDRNLEILLRHRAVMFGLLAVFLACAAFVPALHRLALLAASASVLSFLLLAHSVGGYNADVARVVRADLLAAVLLVAAVVAHWQSPAKA
jgi:hypothetical protein